MTPWRCGYIDGVRGDAQRYKFSTAKAARKYARGYAKGLYWLYLRALLKD